MANSYLQFSVEVPNLTKKEVEWFQQELNGPDENDFNTWEPSKQDAWLKEHGCEEIYDWPGFDHEFDPDGKRQSIILFGEEYGNVDHLCDVLQRYLKAFHPDQSIGVEWACTCSKLRPGEFGGGAAFITAKKQTYVNSGTWLHQQKEAWERRQHGKKRRRG